MSRRLIVAACFALAACSPKPHVTREDLDSLIGLSMDSVGAKLGRPDVITNAGESVWWEIDGVETRDGGKASCHVIFIKGFVNSIKC